MRRQGIALIGSGLVCLAVTAGTAGPVAAASTEPGSQLGSFNLSASAPALQLLVQEPTYCFATAAGSNGCEGVVPEAVSTLRNGPIGTGLAAVAWPGSLAASAGSLLITASSGKVPPGATVLNDPVKAEARTSTGPDTVSFDSIPGTTMKAVAKDTFVSADASVGSITDASVGSIGRSTGSSLTELTGPKTAVAKARSSVSDITLAGVVHIGAVTSQATATTDGGVAKATGSTEVSDVTVAGVPVTVDDRGVSVKGTGVALTAATDLVNQALAKAGITLALSKGSGKPDGAGVTYNAGSLVAVWDIKPGYATSVVLGGANVSVTASPGLPEFSLPPFAPGVPPAAAPPALGGVTSPVTSGGQLTGPTLPGTGGVTPPVVSGPGGDAPAPQPVLAAVRRRLPGGLSPAWAVLGALGSLLVMAGLRRLPDKVLTATAPTCLLEETP
jgi:hypothetical protein